MLSVLQRLTENVYLRLFIALLLCYSGFNDAMASLDDDLTHGHIRTHHAVFLFGLFQSLHCLPQIIEAADLMSKAKKANED